MESAAFSRLNIVEKSTTIAQPLMVTQTVPTGAQRGVNLTGMWADRAGAIAQVSTTIVVQPDYQRRFNFCQKGFLFTNNTDRN